MSKVLQHEPAKKPQWVESLEKHSQKGIDKDIVLIDLEWWATSHEQQQKYLQDRGCDPAMASVLLNQALVMEDTLLKHGFRFLDNSSAP